MTTVKEKEKEGAYLSSFTQLQDSLARSGPSWVYEIRKAAIDSFAELGFPTTHDEDWKYTSVAPLTSVSFRNAPLKLMASVSEKLRGLEPAQTKPDRGIHRPPLLDLGCSRLTFVNGRYCPELSTSESLQEVKVTSLATALSSDGALMEAHLAKYANYRTHPFVALNTAFLEDGAYVEVPKGVVLEKPIHLLYISKPDGQPTVSHPRNLIIVGPTGQASIIETYLGLGDGVYFTNSVTELVAGQGALLDYYRVLQESDPAFHYGRIQVHQERTSRVTTHSIQLGARWVREELETVLDGEGAEALLHGLYVTAGPQHVDNHTTIDHAKAHCSSRELYIGVLDGHATGVFNGKIIVRKDAQKTDSKQSNKNLLLSENATVNTKPQLEIFADDVKCTHGATVGQINAEAIFYLRSRGIALEEARNLLTFAFANEVMERIKYEPLREKLRDGLFDRLAKSWTQKEA
jgi:Fe-S cluster assembly protein SufD